MCTTDFLAAEAAAIFAAANMAYLEVSADVTRKRDGSKRYSLAAYDPDGRRNPLDMHCAFGLSDSMVGALTQLGNALGVAYPLAGPATKAQREELIRVLNQPCITRAEKAREILACLKLTTETADAKILELKAAVNERAGQVVYAEATNYGIVGEAWLVERCDCDSDGCGLCEAGFVRKGLTVAA